jgi:hypothetical protein
MLLVYEVSSYVTSGRVETLKLCLIYRGLNLCFSNKYSTNIVNIFVGRNLFTFKLVFITNLMHSSLLHGRSQRVTIPDAVKYNLDLLKMSIVLL